MLYDRDPQLTILSDKLRTRDFVARKVGSEYLIPLLWHGEKPEEMPFDELPMKFVIKANHGCGYNIVVQDKKQLNYARTIHQMKKWLRQNFCADKYLGTEWGYKNVKPCIIVEAFLDDNGKVPPDYKFYCFSGRVEVLTLHFDRFAEHKTRAFNRDFEASAFRYNFEQWNGKCERPKIFPTMIHVAECLSEDFDFMRVDLYLVNNRIFFGEMTPYPGGVSTKFLPVNEDYNLGNKWKNK